MATNLRLRPEAEEAVRATAARTGQSQQELIREAVDRYLGLSAADAPRTVVETMIATQGVLPARHAYTELDELTTLRPGSTTEELLDRGDRF